MNKEGKAPILVRVTVNGEKVHLATRLYVYPAKWSGKECQASGKSAEEKHINETLDNLRNVIKNTYNELFFRGKTVTTSRLKAIQPTEALIACYDLSNNLCSGDDTVCRKVGEQLIKALYRFGNFAAYML